MYLKYLYYKLYHLAKQDKKIALRLFPFLWGLDVFVIMEFIFYKPKYPNPQSTILSFIIIIGLLYLLQVKDTESYLLKNIEISKTMGNQIIFRLHIFLTLIMYGLYLYLKIIR